MNVIICLDDKNGMTFNSRRQSKDRRVREKMLEIVSGAKLYMTEYSFAQFEENADNIIISSDFCENENDFYFAESPDFPVEKINFLYVFRWNRVYPSDVKFDFDGRFKLEKTEEFEGSSHKKITLEIYKEI